MGRVERSSLCLEWRWKLSAFCMKTTALEWPKFFKNQTFILSASTNTTVNWIGSVQGFTGQFYSWLKHLLSFFLKTFCGKIVKRKEIVISFQTFQHCYLVHQKKIFFIYWCNLNLIRNNLDWILSFEFRLTANSLKFKSSKCNKLFWKHF